MNNLGIRYVPGPHIRRRAIDAIRFHIRGRRALIAQRPRCGDRLPRGRALDIGRYVLVMQDYGGPVGFRMALASTGLTVKATPHTLRHSYATHLLEEGVSIRLISQYLGHSSLQSTLIYTHLTAVSEEKTREALARLHQGVAPGCYPKAAKESPAPAPGRRA